MLKRGILLGCFILVLLFLIGCAGQSPITKESFTEDSDTPQQSSENQPESPKEKPISNLFKPREPTAADFDWSGGRCKGKKGTVPLTAYPISPENIEAILPYGTIDPESGHVTPIDHQYYYPKNREQGPDLYDVFAPADGYIVSIAKRNQFVSEEGGANPVPDYYVVMEHSCSFWTYFDLATSLAPEIMEETGNFPDDDVFASKSVRIPVKAGQKIGKIGLRSLDFGVYDAENNLPGFMVYEHYNGEPWKVHTVDPYDFFVEPIRSELIAKTVRSSEPIGGKIDYDIDGKAIGNWFVKGSGGFPAKYEDKNWRNHLAIFPDAYDPTQFIFSHGNIGGRAKAYGIKKENPNPATTGVETGPVKYELINFEYFIKGTNAPWNRLSYAGQVASKPNADRMEGVALVQLTEPRKLKVEIFMSKTANQVAGFTENAVVYER
ncbi:hypothetical protein HYU12_05320 [Candidatus Woesearchaeota archaeon]|nr:hypothetical protein [Candidatus Woesearchaeota archaeon]